VTGRVQCRTVYLLSTTVCHLVTGWSQCVQVRQSVVCHSYLDSVFSDRVRPVSDSVFIVCDTLSSSDRSVTMCPGQTVCRLLQLDCDSLLSSDRACPMSDSVFIVCDSLSSSDRACPVSDSVFIVCDSLLSSDRLVTMCPGQTVCCLLQLNCDSLLSSDRACPVSDTDGQCVYCLRQFVI